MSSMPDRPTGIENFPYRQHGRLDPVADRRVPGGLEEVVQWERLPAHESDDHPCRRSGETSLAGDPAQAEMPDRDRQDLCCPGLESLASVKIRQATIVVGYKQEMIRAAVGSYCHGVYIHLLVNEGVSTGRFLVDRSAGSVQRRGDHERMRMSCFIAKFSPPVGSLPLREPPADGRTVKQTGEECMVVVQGDRVVALSKKMPDRYDIAGEASDSRVCRADTAHVIGSLKGYIDQNRWAWKMKTGCCSISGT